MQVYSIETTFVFSAIFVLYTKLFLQSSSFFFIYQYIRCVVLSYSEYCLFIHKILVFLTLILISNLNSKAYGF